MRITFKNRAVLAAAGVFVFLGAATAQTSVPNQNGANPDGSTTPPGARTGYPGQGNMNSGNPNTHNGVMDDAGGTSGMSGHGMDLMFAKKAAIGGLTEVELGKLATQKASDEKVKQFGQRMVDDHSKANGELKAIAAKNRMTLPAELDAKHKAMVDKMSGMSGAQFDQAYVRMMVKDHDQDVAEFQQEAGSGAVSDVKGWAAKTLPVIQEHDRMIKELAKNASGSSKSAADHSNH